MIISCPECSTRFLIDPDILGENGRRVRCAKCQHSWTQPPPNVRAEDPPTEQPPESSPLAPDRTDRPPVATGGRRQRKSRRKKGGRAGSETPNLPALPREQRNIAGRLAWLVLFVAVIGSVVGGITYRDRIMAKWPETAMVFEAIGFAREPFAAGLELRNITFRDQMENGVPQLVIAGEVINVSASPRDVPPVHGTVFDKTDQELVTWRVEISEPRLLPGEIVKFSSVLPPPAGRARLSIAFRASK